MEKRRSPDWSELPPELLELVVSKLRFMDVLGFKGVCSSFRLAAKVRSSVTPLLMHQSAADHRDDDEFLPKFGKTVRFLSPQDMNDVIYSPQGKNCLERLLDKGCCVGSSYGWLVVLDKEANPFLLNPFSGAEIELPKKETLPGIIGRGYHDIRVNYDGCVPKMICYVKWTNSFARVSVPAIQRAILTANPSYANNYKVFIIYENYPMRIAFCCRGDKTWTFLCSSKKFYDVAFHNDRLYTIETGSALSERICPWDFSTIGGPQQCRHFVISDFVQQVRNKFRYCTAHYYLVLSSEELFFVFRLIKDNANSIAEDHRDYRTVGFEIYKLEKRGYAEEFVRVESLPSRAMFLGGNHGRVISVQEFDNRLDENSIYFTSNYTDTKLTCLNSEIGIFSLENGNVNLLCDVQKQKPQPFWVSPGQK